ncbi:hypothetical protein [Sediminibacterium soli]|uniref:hypothetical protein n=1 Tax=Sediminibacterium soli TaxID=2698829 RepID=UPI00137981D9|nr:hypothetical protein [Sediminibacterium soli]NCI47382.1 hypothetical protein [Sediminibacterium soli]
MKRIAAILLLGMLLFSWGGYRLFTGFLENRADARLSASIDRNQYSESDLISIKVATSLPYYHNSAEYERVEGEINIKGTTYTYVKRRVYNDSLELLCIPNMEKTGLKKAKENYGRMVNDLAGNNTASGKAGHPSFTAKFSIQDFTDDHGFLWQFKTEESSVDFGRQVFAGLKSVLLQRPDRPPQA